MAGISMSPEIGRLFQSPSASPRAPVIGKGSIIVFSYVGQTRHIIHDPYPLLLVSDVFRQTIRGVNLHYLTLPYVKGIIRQHADNAGFSYAFIKNDSYIVSAFRSYKRTGISQLKSLDSGFLQNLLRATRALNPGELEAMRAQVRQMLSQQTQPSATEAQGEEING